MKRKKIIITYNKDSTSLKDILTELSSTHNSNIIYFIKQDMFKEKDNNIYKIEHLQQEFSTIKLHKADNIRDILNTISDKYTKFKFFVIHESYLQDKIDNYSTLNDMALYLSGYADALDVEIRIIKEKD